MFVSETTIISAFYPMKSKHSIEKYKSWMANFLQIPAAMVIFTTEEFFFEIYNLRKDFLDRTQVLVRPFDSFAMTCPAMRTFWEKQWSIDPEKHIHTPELYAVWALKQEFVRIIVNQNPYRSQWFVWCDIGIQRYPELQHFYNDFPSRVPELCETGRMSFLEVDRIPDEYVQDWLEKKPMKWPIPSVTLGGGCIVGDKDAWEDFGEAYKGMLQEYALRGWFAGKDQMVFFTMLMEHRLKKPYRLFHAKAFVNSPRYAGIEWMCFPVMLGGAMDVPLDTRFEEDTGFKEVKPE
jgi:hypothetical protein